MPEIFDALYPDVPVPKTVALDRHRPASPASRRGHRALSVVDLMLCATAARHAVALARADRDINAAAPLPGTTGTRHTVPSPGSAPSPREPHGR
jgi:hypothetical protein